MVLNVDVALNCSVLFCSAVRDLIIISVSIFFPSMFRVLEILVNGLNCNDIGWSHVDLMVFL